MVENVEQLSHTSHQNHSESLCKFILVLILKVNYCLANEQSMRNNL